MRQWRHYQVEGQALFHPHSCCLAAGSVGSSTHLRLCLVQRRKGGGTVWQLNSRNVDARVVTSNMGLILVIDVIQIGWTLVSNAAHFVSSGGS